MTTTGNRVAAIVVNYASSQHLGALVSSLRSEDVAAIIIWDNYSSDDERQAVKAVADMDPRVRLRLAEANCGFGPGVNEAVAWFRSEDSADFFWILNPDVTVREGTLDQLLQTAHKREVDIISPLIVSPGSGRVWYSGGAVDTKRGRTEHFRIGLPVGKADTGYEEVSFVSGAAPLVSATAWSTLGGFSEQFFLYCEDADLSLRATRAGLRQAVDRAAVVEHAEGGSSTGGSGPGPTFYYYVQRNRIGLYSGYTSRVNLLLGAGLVETLKLLLLTFRPLDRRALSRFSASLDGLRAGLRGEQGPRL